MTIPPLGEPRHIESQKIKDAALNFEAILLAQMLKNCRPTESDAVHEMAEQQLAQVLALNGGMGLSDSILGQLNQKP